MQDEQRKVFGIVGIGQDITARLAQEVEYSKLINRANAPTLASIWLALSTFGINVQCDWLAKAQRR
jgi:hypothetical protein